MSKTTSRFIKTIYITAYIVYVVLVILVLSFPLVFLDMYSQPSGNLTAVKVKAEREGGGEREKGRN